MSNQKCFNNEDKFKNIGRFCKVQKINIFYKIIKIENQKVAPESRLKSCCRQKIRNKKEWGKRESAVGLQT